MNVSPAVSRRPEPGISRNPADGPTELTAKHRKLIAAMVYGADSEAVSSIMRREVVDGETVERPLRPGEPLTSSEAAQLVGLRQRNVRALFGFRIFTDALALEVQRLRDSERPAAMRRIAELRDNPGQGKAADRKVQLQASQALLGDAVGTKPAGTVVNVGVGIAGYCIDLTEPSDAPSASPRVINHGEAGSVIDGRVTYPAPNEDQFR